METQGSENKELKRDFEAKVTSLEQEMSKHKEQYRVTFDQLAEKEKELRDLEEVMETSRAQGTEREAITKGVLDKQRQLCV